MKMFSALMLVIMPASMLAAKPVVRNSIPVAFHGDWALKTNECAPGPADAGNMRIKTRQVVNFESLGKVSRVEILDKNTIRLYTRVVHNGGTFGSLEMISLSNNGQHLRIGEMSDLSVYKRCSK
jgi:hypothetical protein